MSTIFSLLQSLESGAKSDKAVEFIHFTDYWLAKVQNSLVALHTESEEALKHVCIYFVAIQ